MNKGFLKARRPPKVSNEMKCTNENITWNTQDTNLSNYVPKANVDHIICGQETGISTLDHLATTPKADEEGNQSYTVNDSWSIPIKILMVVT